ncbi:MAG: DNA-protecting protein DprA [Phycisphaerales bacterium]|nr:DNA-protecting protein DprA [Phycisphaerales bacterium]
MENITPQTAQAAQLSDNSAAERECCIAWLALAGARGVGPVLVRRLIEAFGSPQTIVGAAASRLAEVEGIGMHRAGELLRSINMEAARTLYEQTTADRISIIYPTHPDWPPGLKHLPDPPVVLFLRGRILPQDVRAIGVVGARRCTLYGREQAGAISRELAAAQVTIVSGGARGIDTAAHEGALRVGGRTLVIQGCGLYHCYPAENVELYDQIVSRDLGAIISELTPDQPPAAENFPPRNRIIAGLSLGVLVVEANLRSGSLITARLAADDYGREVFALPGRVDSPASAGTHHLIKTGSATLVETARDILDVLDGPQPVEDASPVVAPAVSAALPANKTASQRTPAPHAAAEGSPQSHEPAPPQRTLTPTQQTLVAVIKDGSHDVDSVCEASGLPAGVVIAELTLLEISGVLTRTASRGYTLRQ